MDTGNLALILSSVTAIAAVIVPAITTAKTIKSNERMKRLELYSPRLFDAVKRMVDTYSQLKRSDQLDNPNGQELSESEKVESRILCSDFFAACCEVMSLIDNNQIQIKLSTLIDDLDSSPVIDSSSDYTFQQITAAIASEISGNKSKPEKPKNRKAKRSKRK